MAKTFTLRRRKILEGMGMVQDIIKNYPALKYPEEVSAYPVRLLQPDQIIIPEHAGTDLALPMDRIIPKIKPTLKGRKFQTEFAQLN